MKPVLNDEKRFINFAYFYSIKERFVALIIPILFSRTIRNCLLENVNVFSSIGQYDKSKFSIAL